MEDFKREILHFCISKSELSYVETHEILPRGALIRDVYFNDWVSCEITRRHLTKVSNPISFYLLEASDKMRWGLAARAFADGDALDQAFGTAQEVTDANQALDDVNISTATPAITIGGTPAAHNFVQFRAYRNPADANDTLAATAELLSIKITYTRA
jgi:hypothetical protein